MKVKFIKKIKKNEPMEKDGDWNESKKHHAGHADFDFTVCAYYNHTAGFCEHLDTEMLIHDYCSDGERRADNG